MNNTSPKYSRAGLEILTQKRLDPYYYQQPFIDHVKKIRTRFKSFSSLSDVFKILDGTHDSVATQGFQDQDFCVPFLRAQDIGSCYLGEIGAFLRKTDHQGKCKRSKIKHGDVLINIMASTGDACFYSEAFPTTANANRAVGILRPIDESLDDNKRRFFVAALASKIGGLELQRNLKGSIQQRLNLEDVGDCELPIPDAKVQAYIGDKVRQAERLRERSRKLQKLISSMEDEFIPVQRTEPYAKKTWRAKSNLLDEIRLDARYYRPDYVQTVGQASENKNFTHLGDIAFNIRYGTSVKADYVPLGCGITFVRGLNLRRNFIETNEVIDLANHHEEAIGNNFLQSREVLITRSGTVGIAAAVPSILEGSAFGSYMIGMSVEEGWESDFVAWFLNSWMGRTQVERLQNGAIQQNINIAELSSIKIWAANPRIQGLVRTKIKKFQDAKEDSVRLTIAARLLVEALIDGKLTESDLKAAQEDLEQDDTALDREILARLTRKGIDCPKEPPLFPDLDALYDALSNLEDDESSGDESTNGNRRTSNVYPLTNKSLPLASETHLGAYDSTEEVPR